MNYNRVIMQLKMWFEKSKEWEIKEDLIFYLLWLLIDYSESQSTGFISYWYLSRKGRFKYEKQQLFL